MTVMKERRLRGAIPTQRAVAEILGVKESAVSKWELGMAKPRADKLPILAKLYGCTIEELLAENVSDKTKTE
jgi:transcriptional regulator with XRE-family HTH domain